MSCILKSAFGVRSGDLLEAFLRLLIRAPMYSCELVNLMAVVVWRPNEKVKGRPPCVVSTDNQRR